MSGLTNLLLFDFHNLIARFLAGDRVSHARDSTILERLIVIGQIFGCEWSYQQQKSPSPSQSCSQRSLGSQRAEESRQSSSADTHARTLWGCIWQGSLAAQLKGRQRKTQDRQFNDNKVLTVVRGYECPLAKYILRPRV